MRPARVLAGVLARVLRLRLHPSLARLHAHEPGVLACVLAPLVDNVAVWVCCR